MRNGVRVVAAAVYLLLVLAAPRLVIAQTASSAVSWPHTITTENASAVVYEPQAISWTDHEKLLARVAVAITRNGEKTPIVGTLEISLATRTDAATNDVILSDPQLVGSHFPALDPKERPKSKLALERLCRNLRSGESH